MAQHKFFLSDDKEMEYRNLPKEARLEVNKKLQQLFYKILKTKMILTCEDERVE